MERFPQYLSSPIQVLWWEADDLGIIFICFTLALVFGGPLWLLLVFGPMLYSRAKKKHSRGFLKHMLYFIGLKDLSPYPGPFERSFRE